VVSVVAVKVAAAVTVVVAKAAAAVSVAPTVAVAAVVVAAVVVAAALAAVATITNRLYSQKRLLGAFFSWCHRMLITSRDHYFF
jgi:hypothetical protein